MGLHKKSEKCEASTKYEKCIPKTKIAKKRETGERGEESKDSKEREGSKKTGQVLIHSLTPDRPPLAAITGN